MTQEQEVQGKKDYKKSLTDLLDCYVDGRNVLINAPGWDVPMQLKPEHEGKGLPGNYMALQDELCRIIAHEKYGLDTYPNEIQIITSEQMRDAYSKNGMPISYDHWSFGKNLIEMDRAYESGKMGLAYEIVINTNPSIAYCMDTNSKTMQLLVTAHASYGHNSFFKGNHLFRQFTRADNIIEDLKVLKRNVETCERLFGEEETERLLDACHALQYHAVNRYTRPERRSPEEEKALRQKMRDEDRLGHDEFMSRATNIFSDAAKKKGKEKKQSPVVNFDEENILGFIATYAPHMEEEKRELLRNFCRKAQYFYPQMQTQLMNEGWASFWHYTILYDLYDEDIIDDAMMMEALSSHSGVVFQPGYDSPYFSGGLNPYALGIAIYQDIKRICLEPTEEDREWFPDFAGNPDWVSVLKDAMEGYKDESFVSQFLSPKLMRDFRLFVLKDDAKEPTLKVSDIHNEYGYRGLRQSLASQYDLSSKLPCMRVSGYTARGDRSLILEHQMYDGRPLDDEDMEQVMVHLYYLWKHPVVLRCVDQSNNKTINTMTCPPWYDADQPQFTLTI